MAGGAGPKTLAPAGQNLSNVYKMRNATIVTAVFFMLSLTTACEEGAQTVHQSLSEKERLNKIKNLLTLCQITVSEIDSTLSYEEDTVTLNKNFTAYSGSTVIRVRTRGVLLSGNKVLTGLSISGGGATANNSAKPSKKETSAISSAVYLAKRVFSSNTSPAGTKTAPAENSNSFLPPNRVYAGLFDGEKKRLISTYKLGDYLSIVSVTENKSDSSIIEISALVRSAKAPAGKIQTFQVTVEDGNIKSLN